MRATARVDEFLRDDCARVVSDGNQRVAVDQPSQKSMECAPAFRRGYIPGPLARPSPPRAHLIKRQRGRGLGTRLRKKRTGDEVRRAASAKRRGVATFFSLSRPSVRSGLTSGENAEVS